MPTTVLREATGMRVTCAACGDVVPSSLATRFTFRGHTAPYCHVCSFEHAANELVEMSRELAEAF